MAPGVSVCVYFYLFCRKEIHWPQCCQGCGGQKIAATERLSQGEVTTREGWIEHFTLAKALKGLGREGVQLCVPPTP